MREKCEALALLAAPAWPRGGVPTLPGRNRSRNCPENVKLFRYVVHKALETNFKKTVLKKTKTNTKKICSELCRK